MPTPPVALFDWERVRRFTQSLSSAESAYILKCFHEWRRGNDLLTVGEAGDEEEDASHLSDRELERMFEGFKAGWSIHTAITAQ
jgi:hypothetical protein